MDIYGDGDQSNYTREPGSPGDDLCIHWANGGNFNPYQRPSSYTSFFKACSWGDYAEVEAILQETKNNSERNLFELLEYRESSLRKNPLSACIAGSRILEKFGSNSWPFSENNIHYFIDDFGIPQAIFIDAGSIASIGHITPQEISQKIQSYRKRIDFIKVAKLLLDHDCRVDSKDIIGVCPVGAAAGSHATKLSLEIATLIVQKGGDLALKPLTRNGECILTAPLISNRVDVCAHLLALGADPHASFANDNFRPNLVKTPYKMAHLLATSEMRKVFSKKAPIRCANCNRTQAASIAKKLGICTRCRMVYYCVNSSCNKEHWPTHKHTCSSFKK